MSNAAAMTLEGQLETAHAELAARDALIDEQRVELDALRAQLEALRVERTGDPRMGYAELFAAVAAVLPEKISFSIDVQTWRHVHAGEASLDTHWTIWDGVKSHVAPDAAGAFKALRKALIARINKRPPAPEEDATGVGRLVSGVSGGDHAR